MGYGKPAWSNTASSGSSNAASLTLGNHGSIKFDVHYEVSGTDGKIEVEVDVSDPTDDGTTNWKSFDTIDTSNSGTDRQDFVQYESTGHAVRVYADSGDFSDSQVTDISIMARLAN